MALRHRKLFSALTAVNQTEDCQGFCEEACPYNCNPYPDYYFWPSPPPPPPPPQPLSTQNHNIIPYVIVVVIILAILFLAVSYYLIAGGSQCGWFGSRNNRQQQQPQSQAENRDEEFVDEIQPVAHPIWFIATMGLHHSTINSITIIKYRKEEGLIEGTVCSVCLNEFQQGETLRLLPKCSHAFHISCIDAWLRSHTNCPLCRARIVDEAVGASVISVNRNPDNSNANVNSQMENPEINVELGNAQERNEACEGRGGAEEECEIEHVGDERILKGEMDSDRNDELQLPCNPADNHKKDVSVQKALTLVKSKTNHKLTKNDMQQIRRSLSMDHLTCPIVSQGRSVRPVENAEKIGSAVDLKKAKRQCLHTIPSQRKDPHHLVKGYLLRDKTEAGIDFNSCKCKDCANWTCN